MYGTEEMLRGCGHMMCGSLPKAWILNVCCSVAPMSITATTVNAPIANADFLGTKY